MSEHHIRKMAGGIALIVTPALVLASWLLWPVTPLDAERFVGDLTRYGDVRVAASMACAAAALAFGVVAIVALVHVLREKRGLLGLVGGGMAIMGSVLFSAQIGISISAREMVTAAFPTAAKDVLVQRILDADMLMVVYVGAAMFTAGIFLLAMNLLLARVVPWPVALLVACYPLVQAAGYGLFNPPTVLASTIVLALGLVPIGMKILSESDDEWQHPPTFVGFHTQNGHREMATADGRATAKVTRSRPAPARREAAARTPARARR